MNIQKNVGLLQQLDSTSSLQLSSAFTHNLPETVKQNTGQTVR